MIWVLMRPDATREHLGYVPQLFNDEDPRPAAQQLDQRYAHGGGWSPFGRGTWKMRKAGQLLVWPGSHEDGEPDEVLQLIAMAALPLSEEMLLFYPSALLAVMKPDGSFEVTRVD